MTKASQRPPGDAPARKPNRTYEKQPEDVWRLIRRRYEAGEPIVALSRTFRVAESTIRNRVNAGCWQVLASPDDPPEEGSALSIAETALTRAQEALAQGRAGDALALIKAGDAVGAFADFVRRLRAGEAEPEAEPGAP